MGNSGAGDFSLPSLFTASTTISIPISDVLQLAGEDDCGVFHPSAVWHSPVRADCRGLEGYLPRLRIFTHGLGRCNHDCGRIC